MISFDLFDKRLKLFRYDFVHGFVRWRVAIARTTRPVPAILHVDRVENNKDVLSYCIQIDLSQKQVITSVATAPWVSPPFRASRSTAFNACSAVSLLITSSMAARPTYLFSDLPHLDGLRTLAIPPATALTALFEDRATQSASYGTE